MSEKEKTTELEKQMELLEKLTRQQEAFNEEQAAQFISAQRNLSVMVEQNTKWEEQIALLKKSKTAQKDEAKKSKEELAVIDEKIAGLKAMSKHWKDHADLTSKTLEDSRKKFKEAADEMARYSARGPKELEQMGRNVRENAELDAEMALRMVEGGVEGVGTMIRGMYDHPLLVAGAMMGFAPGLATFKKQITDMPGAIDTAFSKVTKETGVSSQQINDAMTYMLDPLYAQRKEGLFLGLAEDAKPMANIGLSAEEAGRGMKALIADASLFRPTFIENNKAAAAFVGNLLSGLGKLGVPVKTSAKNLDTFTRAMQMAPMEAAKGIKSLASVADSLGLEMGQVSQNFDTISKDIVMFGDNAVKVFGKLQAQAQATGVEVGRLSEYAKGLDTFEGAAEAAQGLNAVLGDSLISVTDLVHADFPDKISMIQQAMADAGIDFETADRRMKQVIANAAGFSDVGEAAKILTNKEATEEAMELMETVPLSQEDIKARIEEGMTTAEQMTKTLSSLGGGARDFNQVIKEQAASASGTVVTMFADIVKHTGDSKSAFAGVAGSMEAFKQSAEAAANFARAVPLVEIMAMVTATAGGAAVGAVGVATAITAVTAATDVAEGAGILAPGAGKTETIMNLINEMKELKDAMLGTEETKIKIELDGIELGEVVAPYVMRVTPEQAGATVAPGD